MLSVKGIAFWVCGGKFCNAVFVGFASLVHRAQFARDASNRGDPDDGGDP